MRSLFNIGDWHLMEMVDRELIVKNIKLNSLWRFFLDENRNLTVSIENFRTLEEYQAQHDEVKKFVRLAIARGFIMTNVGKERFFKGGSTLTLFDLWVNGNIEVAIDDIKQMNKKYSWDVKIPKRREQAIESYNDERMVKYVYNAIIETLEISTGETQLLYFEKKLAEAKEEDLKKFYKKKVDRLKKDIKAYIRVKEFIESNYKEQIS